jgi:hypothetical protein
MSLRAFNPVTGVIAFSIGWEGEPSGLASVEK